MKAVRNFWKRLQAVIKTVRRGAPRKLLPKLARAIVRRARSGKYSAKQLEQHYNAGVSVRRVQQVLAAAPELEWRKIMLAPRLTKKKKDNRVDWLRYRLHGSSRFWDRVV